MINKTGYPLPKRLPIEGLQRSPSIFAAMVNQTVVEASREIFFSAEMLEPQLASYVNMDSSALSVWGPVRAGVAVSMRRLTKNWWAL